MRTTVELPSDLSLRTIYFLNDFKMCCRRWRVFFYWSADWPFTSTCLHEGNPPQGVLIGSKPYWLSDTSAGIWGLISSERCQQDFFFINYNSYHIYMHQSLSLLMNYFMVVFENKSLLCVLHLKWSRALSEAIKHHQCALDIDTSLPSPPPPLPHQLHEHWPVLLIAPVSL